MDEHIKRFELMEYINVLLKRKWLILIPTFFIVLIAGLISFLLTSKWEIDILMQPGTYVIPTADGKYNEMTTADLKELAAQINEASYDHTIAAELNIDLREFPKLRAETPENTSLIRIYTRDNDVEKAKKVLNSSFNLFKNKLAEKNDAIKKIVDAQVNAKEIAKLQEEETLKINMNKLNIVRQSIKDTEQEMSGIRKRLDELDKEHRLILEKENRKESGSLALLLYSNEIQQSLIQHNRTLYDLLISKKIEEEDMNLQIKQSQERINLIEGELISMKEVRGLITDAQLIKEPTASSSRVSPRKIFNVLISGLLSLMVFTILAFFLEYIERQKKN